MEAQQGHVTCAGIDIDPADGGCLIITGSPSGVVTADFYCCQNFGLKVGERKRAIFATRLPDGTPDLKADGYVQLGGIVTDEEGTVFDCYFRGYELWTDTRSRRLSKLKK